MYKEMLKNVLEVCKTPEVFTKTRMYYELEDTIKDFKESDIDQLIEQLYDIYLVTENVYISDITLYMINMTSRAKWTPERIIKHITNTSRRKLRSEILKVKSEEEIA